MPITRKEAFLSAIANGASSSIDPVTREEQLLSDIANGTASKVLPITRKEMLLSAISKGQKPNIEPITREEQYLAYIGGANTKTPESPITSTEFWLDKIANGGSGGGGGDQTALAGAYTADGTFSNRVYTWDELVARSENYEEPYADIKKESETELYASSYDLVVPDTQTYAGYFYCKNIVLPKTTTYIGGTDTSNDIRVYVKATVPPTLDEYAFFEHAEIELDGYVGGGRGYTVEIIVPIGYGDIYKAATNWSLYADYITEGAMPI